jgi:antitoxin YobK
MSMEKFAEAKALVEDSGIGDFEGPKSESLVSKAELALNLIFPPSYRQFLLQMGCGAIGGFEIFGLIDENFQRSSVPNGIWVTINGRRSFGLEPAFLIIGEGGDGTYCALDSRFVDASGEVPVVRLSANGKFEGKVADTFGEFFLEGVKRSIA